jgi:hypothetical protein
MSHFIFKRDEQANSWEFLERFEDFEAGKKARDSYRKQAPGARIEMTAAETEAQARIPTTLLWNPTPKDVEGWNEVEVKTI